MKQPKYKRILLKLSGEALSSGEAGILDFPFIETVAQQVKRCVDAGVQVAVIVGAGNIWRGRQGTGMEQCRADHMGMLATVMNSLALADGLEEHGLIVRVQTAIEMRQIAEPYIRNKADRHLEKGRVVIFGCGTGNPFFTTDTAAALRAVEIGADVILLAKNVDAVYDSDPKVNPNAKKIEKISYIDVLNQGLGVMDTTATSLCMDNKIAIHVFGINEPENLVKAVCGEKIGTIIN
jgi:uridylate kinase